jgi:hypothetical protein
MLCLAKSGEKHGPISMKRKLTDEEKRKAEKIAMERADRSIGTPVSVKVEDETNEDGQVRWTVLYSRVTEMPKGWKP